MASNDKCIAVIGKDSYGPFLEITKGHELIPKGTIVPIKKNFIKKFPKNPIEISFKEVEKKTRKR